MSDLKAIMAATKTLDGNPSWVVDHDDTNQYTLDRVPVSIGGVTESGLYLTGSCLRFNPDYDVTFQLIYKPYTGFKGPLTRFDWNPIGTHSNNGIGDRHYRFRPFHGTHFHPFDENHVLGEEVMAKDNLPIAYPTQSNPVNFRAMLAEVGNLFKVDNMQVVGEPPYDMRLL